MEMDKGGAVGSAVTPLPMVVYEEKVDGSNVKWYEIMKAL